MSNVYEIEKSFDLLLSIQCNFSYSIAERIFFEQTDHFWSKWLKVEGNIISFLASLDVFNRNKVISWAMSWSSNRVIL
jgi:hypothetical protein